MKMVRVLSPRLSAIIVSVLLFSSPNSYAQAQWVPIVAKHHLVVTHIGPDGSERVTHEGGGWFFRSSSGQSMWTDSDVVNGVEGPATRAVFEDKARGKTYEVSYRSKRAVLKSQNRPAAGPANLDRLKKSSVSERVVNGIPCMGFPIKDGRNGQIIGVYWRSLEYDILVRIERESDHNGVKIREIRELQDIQLNTEPPQGAADIPADFQISEAPSQPG